MTGNSSNDPTHPGPPRSIDADWEALARYYAGESTDAEAAAVRAWLAANPAEAARFEAIEAGIQRVSADLHADIDVEAALKRVAVRRDEAAQEKPRLVPAATPQRAARTPAAPSHRSTMWSWRVPALAAAGVGAIALGALVLRSRNGAPSTPAVAVAAKEMTTGVGQRDSIRLADGSRVLLGPMSRLRVLSGFGGSTRTVELRGDGLFDVQHDDAHPFVVRAGDAVIRDVGTTFTVEASDSSQVRVVVTSGTVHVATAADSSGVLLQAGDIGDVRAGQGPVVRRKAANQSDLAWTRGQLAFRNAPLTTVADELKRWYGIDLVLADSSLRGRTLNTTFVRESREQALRIIELTLGVRIEMRGDTAIMHGPTGAPRR
jgi:transmembrane sensor